MNTIFNFYAVGLFLVVFSGCEKKDPIIPNDEELITTVQLFKISEIMPDSLMASFRDLDGSGGNDPEWVNPIFIAHSTYSLKWVFLNETTNPPDDISVEIMDEAVDHQIFYLSSPGLTMVSAYVDEDENGNPLGLQFKLQTGEPSAGKWKLVLRHLPDKFAVGVSAGIMENAGGETDIEISFDAAIQ